jgi:hypothetical protein
MPKYLPLEVVSNNGVVSPPTSGSGKTEIGQQADWFHVLLAKRLEGRIAARSMAL